ncbi:MAG TPA: serine/threonine-protein kinase [Polyangiaceae bacterium]|nr:serine/threonine-protein kinase [Polyangiaceae bacterium]
MSARFEHDIGDHITGKRGDYRVKQRLGAGGMGACYTVEDTDAPRQYVLKTIQSQLASKKSALEAFELEARGLIALHACPNIVQAYHLDQTPAGVPFYLMEVLSGLSVREMLRRRKSLHIEAAIGIGIGIAKALVFAHDKEVVHCDLKPDNVFVVRSSDGPLVKLLDFGVMKAKLVRAGYQGAAGTPAYMAPEQLRGEEVDARADIFAFACILYEIIAGKHPFADFGIDEKGVMSRIDQKPAGLNTIAKHLSWKVVNPLDELLEKMFEPRRDKRVKDASYVLVKLHELERVMSRMTKGDVHAATTNPGEVPQELIAQMTGVVDEEAVAGKTDPNLDLSSEPELAAAVARSVDDSTVPPSDSLPEPDKNLPYLKTEAANSYERAEKAAKLLPEDAKKKASRKAKVDEGIELTSGEREYVDNLAKHAEKRGDQIVLRGKPRPKAAATVVEGDDYHKRMRMSERPWALPVSMAIAALLAAACVFGYYLWVHR